MTEERAKVLFLQFFQCSGTGNPILIGMPHVRQSDYHNANFCARLIPVVLIMSMSVRINAIPCLNHENNEGISVGLLCLLEYKFTKPSLVAL